MAFQFYKTLLTCVLFDSMDFGLRGYTVTEEIRLITSGARFKDAIGV